MTEEEIKQIVLNFHNIYEQNAKEIGYITRNDTREFDFDSLNGKTMYKTIKEIMNNYIPKQTIKYKIEELKKIRRPYDEPINAQIDILQELLGE